jgi:uncharacterized protein
MSDQYPHAITPVTTSTACFIGRTIRGPAYDPQRCVCFEDFDRIFGSDMQVSDMSQAVRLFFLNGGIACWVTRIKNKEGFSQIQDYNEAFTAIDRKVDLFNLMILPKEGGAHAAPVETFYGIASIFCQKKRAFLIMDPPAFWMTSQDAMDPETGINSLRKGIIKDMSAIYFPRLLTTNLDGSQSQTGPAGAIAGMMARIDNSQGVWRSPAGREADIRGISGLTYQINDQDIELLNAAGINSIRMFPVISWDARTNDGDDALGSQWKFISVRRTVLFIEESLRQGLEWVIFEPNNESLWTKIRLGVESFMHHLFLEGAFQGPETDEAFFVKCDGDTTSQNDINNGIVNIQVGFAPLSPAEFIIISIQLLTCQDCE